MRFPGRIGLFLAGAAGLVVLYVLAYVRLPGPRKPPSPYGQAINTRVVPERHITDAVTAVNFDYRGFDTLGEEFILFVSVMGTLVLLREAHGAEGRSHRDAARPQRDVGPSAALRVWTLMMTGPTVLFGLYTVAHGQLTPGGGFQGGVVLATAPLLIYLTENFQAFKRITSHPLVEITEALGAAGYAIIGVIALIYGREYLTNVLPLGEKGNVLSGGTVCAINWATGLEVTAGFVLLLYAFLEKTLADVGGR